MTQPMTPDMFREMEQLLDLCCEEQLSDVQVRRLQELVNAHDDACDYYVRHVYVHAGLRRIWREDSDAGGGCEPLPHAPPADPTHDPTHAQAGLSETPAGAGPWPLPWMGIGPALSSPWRLAILMLSLGIIVGGGGVHLRDSAQRPSAARVTDPAGSPQPTSIDFVARLTDVLDCKWGDTVAAPGVGDPLVIGQTIEFESGTVALEFSDQVVVHLQGPASCRIISRRGLFLSRGKLVALLGNISDRFTVETPVLSITNGREFAVDVGVNGITDLLGSKGLVSYDIGRRRSVQTLPAGTAVRILPTGAIEQGIVRQRTEFPFELTSKAATGVVNIDFNLGERTMTYQGPAAYSSGENYWNDVDARGGRPSRRLRNSANRPTHVTIELTPTFAHITHVNNTGHPLEDDYAVVRNATGGFVLRGLVPHASYSLFLYGTAGKSFGEQTQLGSGAAEGSIFTIGDVTRATVGLRQGDKEFVEGRDYVIFSDIKADERGEIRGTWTNNPAANHPVNENPFGPFNGLQIIGEIPMALSTQDAT